MELLPLVTFFYFYGAKLVHIMSFKTNAQRYTPTRNSGKRFHETTLAEILGSKMSSQSQHTYRRYARWRVWSYFLLPSTPLCQTHSHSLPRKYWNPLFCPWACCGTIPQSLSKFNPMCSCSNLRFVISILSPHICQTIPYPCHNTGLSESAQLDNLSLGGVSGTNI